MTVQDVAKNLKMGWHTVKAIDKTYLEKHFSRPPLRHVQYLGIDEFAVQKGHKYNTIVVDLGTGAVLYVGDGRSAESLKPFWKRLKSSGAKIKAVAMDMWPAYIEAVTTNLPGVDIVYDHFHIVKNLNAALDEVRRDMCRQETDLNRRSVIKGKRWLLLKNSQNLNEKKNEKALLQDALKMNEPLAAAYYLKEELRLLWDCKEPAQAEDFLHSWAAKARLTGLKAMNRFANSLMGHRSGILNYFRHRISTGMVEGINNKIKVLKRKAYGFRDNAYFKLKILALNKVRYAFLL